MVISTSSSLSGLELVRGVVMAGCGVVCGVGTAGGVGIGVVVLSGSGVGVATSTGV